MITSLPFPAAPDEERNKRIQILEANVESHSWFGMNSGLRCRILNGNKQNICLSLADNRHSKDQDILLKIISEKNLVLCYNPKCCEFVPLC